MPSRFDFFIIKSPLYSLRLLYAFKWLFLGIGITVLKYQAIFMPYFGPLYSYIGYLLLTFSILGFLGIYFKNYYLSSIFAFWGMIFYGTLFLEYLFHYKPTTNLLERFVDLMALCWLFYKLQFDKRILKIT